MIIKTENEDLEKQVNKLVMERNRFSLILVLFFIMTNVLGQGIKSDTIAKPTQGIELDTIPKPTPTLEIESDTISKPTLGMELDTIAKPTSANKVVTQITPSSTSYEKGEKYIIGGIVITGLQKFEESTVKVYTGLRVGQTIKLPGDKLTSAIKKLYSSNQFSDIDVSINKLEGNKAYLGFNVIELPKISSVKFSGVSKSKSKDLKKETSLNEGEMLTDNLVVTSKNYIRQKYTKKGYLKAKVSLNTQKDTTDTNAVNVKMYIDKGRRVKIKDIIFKGNSKLSDRTLRKVMKKTKRRMFGRFWKRSKYVEKEYRDDLTKILEKYSESGYRDARILSDNLVWNKGNTINLEIEIEEGTQYRFKDIIFIGNKKYTDEQLKSFLRIDKGDIYNGKVLRDRVTGDPSDPDSQDIQTLYHNNGYVFSSVTPVETGVVNDSITIEIRIREDEIARVKKVSVSGNEKTNDHVIYRELRVKPGDVFSRQKLIRSIRELGQLGFFDANIQPDVQTNYQDKTVSIDFPLTEKGGSQIELQGGYGGGSLIGTLGLSFNNFSIQNIFNKEEYKPLPMGDGQRLSLRAQASKSYETYSFSFSEPWLGGKTPKNFSFSIYLSNQYQQNYTTYKVDRDRHLKIFGTSIGISQRLKWPDDFFGLSQSVSYQRIKVNSFRYPIGRDYLGQGILNNLAYNIGLSRNSAGPSLIFPTYGSEFNIRLKATLPYSLMNKKDLTLPEYATYQERQDYLADKYKWLEYYKVSFGGKWYTELAKKFVMMSNFQFGYLGTYNKELGLTPVERYYLGGDGQAQGSRDGREVIGLRGYENGTLSPSDGTGGSIYNKFQMELRYSITDKPSASIYTLAFVEAGNAYSDFTKFNPFKLKRSAGLGVRVFMPAFGLLGIDFGHGFDKTTKGDFLNQEKSGWQTHFVIGRQF